MSSDPTLPENPEQTTAIVEVDPNSQALVETPSHVAAPGEIQQETLALIEALKNRAQAELHNAGELTQEAYLKAVKQARVALEEHQLINRDNVEQAMATIQAEAERNWQKVFHEVKVLGDRLSDAAKAAWETFKDPH